jgi:ADP-heptose:LPS heptosyltransferase
LLKTIEIAFRRFLLRALGVFIHRNRPLPPNVDAREAKFLFVRQDRIGDVLVSTPLFSELKAAFPNATIDVLLSTNNHFVLENDPFVRKRWVYRKNFFAIITLLRELRAERYDFVIDLMDNPSATSTLLLAGAGGRWNVGLEKENAYVYDICVPLLSRKETHIVDRLAELLKVFGIQVDNTKLRLRYHTSQASVQFAAHFWNEHQLENKTVVGINISPTDGVRFWGISNYQTLIRALQEHYASFRVLLLYHPAERHVASTIAAPFPNVLLSPETHSFDQFAAMIQRLNFIISPDTSAVHVAAAFQVPSVVLYVQSNPNLRIWDPYHSPSETLVTPVDDLTTISPATVLEAFGRLVKQMSSTVSTAKQVVPIGS